MKRSIIALLVFLSLHQFAQVNLMAYKTVFFQEAVYECEDYKLYLVRCFAREEVLKIKIRVFNKTNDIIYVKPEAVEFVINGKSLFGKGRPFTVQPNGDGDRIVDVIDKSMNMKCESFEVTLNGFYKIAYAGEAYIIPNTNLPAQKGSEVLAGPIKCTLKDNQLDAAKGFAKYSCSYAGDKIAILEPSKCVAIMSTGKENSCTVKKNAYILENGESDDMTIEFKALKGGGELYTGIQVKWNETFRTTNAISLKTIKVPMKIDLDKSEK